MSDRETHIAAKNSSPCVCSCFSSRATFRSSDTHTDWHRTVSVYSSDLTAVIHSAILWQCSCGSSLVRLLYQVFFTWFETNMHRDAQRETKSTSKIYGLTATNPKKVWLTMKNDHVKFGWMHLCFEWCILSIFTLLDCTCELDFFLAN